MTCRLSVYVMPYITSMTINIIWNIGIYTLSKPKPNICPNNSNSSLKTELFLLTEASLDPQLLPSRFLI